MSGIALLDELRRGAPSNVSPRIDGEVRINRAEICERMSGNLCRCGAYNGIIDAIAASAGGVR
jgi:xanthine dehydrogenase YagT iron-sulfur-binding subunit